MTTSISEVGRPVAHSLAATWHQRHMTAQFQDDPLRNLVLNNQALTDCYTLLEDQRLLDLEALLQEIQTKTKADLIVYRNVATGQLERATTEAEREFIRTFYDGPLQVLSSFSFALEFCLMLLSREYFVQLENELHLLQAVLKEKIAACYRWVQAADGSK